MLRVLPSPVVMVCGKLLATPPLTTLMPPTVSQLGWLGLSPTTLATLAPHITLLPERTVVNANTAQAEVLMAAIDGLDSAGAERIMQAREARHFRTVEEVNKLLGTGAQCACGVQSNYFEVRGRLRIGGTMVDERSLVRRVGQGVTTLWRERGAFDREPTP